MNTADNKNGVQNGVAVVIEGAKNPQHRTFNVATQISKMSAAYIDLPEPPDGYYITQLGPIGRQLVERIQGTVSGVEVIGFGRYRMSITINASFEWEVVEPAILDVIAEVIGATLDVRYSPVRCDTGDTGLVVDYDDSDYPEEWNDCNDIDVDDEA